jgi:urocanate reductase
MGKAEEEPKKVSRRQFVKGAAAGAAGAAAIGALASCAPAPTAAPGETPAPAPTCPPAGECAPCPSAFVPETWDQEADVVVVGSGCAALPAAIIAAEAGATVAVLEKLPTIGGNSLAGGGNYGAFDTEVTREFAAMDPAEAEQRPDLFEGDSAELYAEDKLRLGGYRNDPALTKVFGEQCRDGYYWLRDLGYTQNAVDAEDETEHVPDNPKGHNYMAQWNREFDENGVWLDGPFRKGRHHTGGKYGDYKNGEAMIWACADKIATLPGAQILTEMQVTAIIREGGTSGDVLGVKVKDLKNDKELYFKANKGVILGAGGWHANAELSNRWDPRLPTDSVNTGSAAPGRTVTADAPGRGATGEVLMAAIDVGADTNLLGSVQLRMPRSAVAYQGAQAAQIGGPGPWVDGEGQRFTMETEHTQHRYALLTTLHVKKVKTMLGTGRWWVIFDSTTLAEEDAATIAEHLETKKLYMGNTIEELAAAIQVPPANLAAAVERWNELKDKGADEDYGLNKDVFEEHPKIEVPPFYAYGQMIYRHHSLGGVRITPKSEVLDRYNNEVIPRLYAAGEFTGNLHGIERDGGCSYTDGVVFGRIAGAEAAALEPWG